MKPAEIASSEMKCKNTETDEFMDDTGENLCTESNMSWELEEVSCEMAEMGLFMDPSSCIHATTKIRHACCTKPTGESTGKCIHVLVQFVIMCAPKFGELDCKKKHNVVFWKAS